MIPSRLVSYRKALPILEDVRDWQLLRKWSLSEVYRVTMSSGDIRILKWGGNEMAREAAIYSNLLSPLQIKAPHIYDFCEDEEGGVILMEDCGRYNLEQEPQAGHFIESAKELARIRTAAADHLSRGAVPLQTVKAYTVTAEELLQQLEDLSHACNNTNHFILQKAIELFPQQLEQVYKHVPMTLVHHDFHAKNLLVQGESILPIDWSIAYLSPHLGDLYCLINEARSWSGLSGNEILDAYLSVSGTNHIDMEQLIWQVTLAVSVGFSARFDGWCTEERKRYRALMLGYRI